MKQPVWLHSASVSLESVHEEQPEQPEGWLLPFEKPSDAVKFIYGAGLTSNGESLPMSPLESLAARASKSVLPRLSYRHWMQVCMSMAGRAS